MKQTKLRLSGQPKNYCYYPGETSKTASELKKKKKKKASN